LSKRKEIYIMSRMSLVLAGTVLVLAGCSRPAPDRAPVKAANQALLAPFHLAAKPAATRSVPEVLEKAADGEDVVVDGQIPPKETQPFFSDRAGFYLHAPEDLINLPECLEPG
jgi:hypothetical protein